MRATEEKQALRAQHTCVLKSTSIGCRACDRGVPYPALTVAEIIDALNKGSAQSLIAASHLRNQRVRKR